MKTSHRCPKCGHETIWRLEQIGVDGENDHADPIRLVARRLVSDRGATALAALDPKRYSAGHLDAYVCESCSYVELYSVGLEDVVPRSDDGIHRLAPADSDDPVPSRAPPAAPSGAPFALRALWFVLLLIGWSVAAIALYVLVLDPLL